MSKQQGEFNSYLGLKKGKDRDIVDSLFYDDSLLLQLSFNKPYRLDKKQPFYKQDYYDVDKADSYFIIENYKGNLNAKK